MRFAQKPILTSGDMSQASVTSIGLDLNQCALGAIQAVWTGAPVGTLILQISCDEVAASITSDPAANVVNWTTYTGSSTAVNGAGDFTWNLLDIGYRWLRMKYTKTSGTGSISATFTAKGV